jgi:microcystin-dependent protein
MTTNSPNTRIDARVVSAFDLSTKAYIPHWTSLEWSEQLNDVGSGTLRMDFKDPFFELFNTQYGEGALFNGTYAIQVIREGIIVFTFMIEDTDVQRAGYAQEIVMAGRGIGAQLEWATVLPEGYHAGMNIVQDTGGTDVTYDREILSYEYLAQAATTTNLSAVYTFTTATTGKLTASANGSINNLAIDGVTDLVVGSIVLVKNQTDARQNGIYYVSVLGNAGAKWVLEYDANFYFNEKFCYVGGNTYVQYGTTQKEKVFKITACPTSEAGFSSTNITFAQATEAYTAISLFYALFREADEGVQIVTTKGPTWGNQSSGYGRGGSGKSVDWGLSLDATLSFYKGLKDSNGNLPKDGGLTNLGRGQTLLQTLQTAAEQTECDWYVSPAGIISIARKPTVTNTAPIGTDRTGGANAVLLPLPLAASSQTKSTTRDTRTVVYGTNSALIDVAESAAAISIAGRRESYIENTGDDTKSATNIATTALAKVAGAKLGIDIEFIEVDGRQAWIDFSVGDKILVEYEIGVFAQRIVSGISGSVDSSFTTSIQLTLDEIIPDAVTSLQNQSIYGTSQASILRASLNNNRGSVAPPRLAVEPFASVRGLSNAVSLSVNAPAYGQATSYEAQVYRTDGMHLIIGRSRTSGVATLTTSEEHTYEVGDRVSVSGMSTYDVTDAAITAVGLVGGVKKTFQYNNPGSPDTGGLVTGEYTSESSIVITDVVKTNGLCTVTTSREHGLQPGQHIIVSDSGTTEIDDFDKAVISTPTTTTFTYSKNGIDATSSTGRLKKISELHTNRIAAGQNSVSFENLGTSGRAYYSRVASINSIGIAGLPSDPVTFFSSAAAMEVVGGAIKSPNYVGGTTGWIIRSDGSAEFSNVTVRGNINSSTITGGSIDIGGNDSTSFHADSNGNIWSGSASLVSSGPSSGRSPFYVLSDGTLFARNATIAGEINASSGTFSGTITATGTISGGTISSGTISGGVIQGTEIRTAETLAGSIFGVATDGNMKVNNIVASANDSGGEAGLQILANGTTKGLVSATSGSVYIFAGASNSTRIGTGIDTSKGLDIISSAGGGMSLKPSTSGAKMAFGTNIYKDYNFTFAGDIGISAGGLGSSNGDIFSLPGFSGRSGTTVGSARAAYIGKTGRGEYLATPSSSITIKENISVLSTSQALADIMTLSVNEFTYLSTEDMTIQESTFKALDYDRGFMLEDFDSSNFKFVTVDATEEYLALTEEELLLLDETALQDPTYFTPTYWKESSVLTTSVAAIQELKGITDLIQEAADGLVPIGTVQAYAGDAGMLTSDKWLFCDGTYFPVSLYPDLYDVLTSYGTVFPYGANIGTGEDATFCIPNLSKRVPVGFDYGNSDADFDSPGNTGGAKTHTLTSAEMPSHTHTQDAHGHDLGPGQSFGMSFGGNTGAFTTLIAQVQYINQGSYQGPYSANSTTATNQNTGGGGAHNNMQPYIVMHYIIKCK